MGQGDTLKQRLETESGARTLSTEPSLWETRASPGSQREEEENTGPHVHKRQYLTQCSSGLTKNTLCSEHLRAGSVESASWQHHEEGP